MRPSQLLSRFQGTLFLSALLLLCTGAPLIAQFTSAIEGRVTDPSEAGVPKAVVTVENSATGVKRLDETSGDGYYRLASLPPGNFTIRVTAPGFETGVFENVLLENDQTKTFNLPLKLGASATQVTVTSEVPLVETGEAKVSGHIDEKEVANLPLVGRNFL
jgi:Carboxypeptidase regulatory-like domain